MKTEELKTNALTEMKDLVDSAAKPPGCVILCHLTINSRNLFGLLPGPPEPEPSKPLMLLRVRPSHDPGVPALAEFKLWSRAEL